MEGIVTLKYKLASGSFTSTKDIQASVQAYVRFEPDSDSSSETTDNTVNIVGKARVMVRFKIDSAQLDPRTTNGDTLFLFLNDLRCSTLIHLYYAGTSINGYTYWNATNNTNYLVPVDVPDVEFATGHENNRRLINFTLMLREARILA